MSTGRMQVGINYAWKNYAWDFGLPPHSDSGNNWGPRAAWRATIEQELASFAEMGLFCVRWFLLGDGTTYGVGDAAPHVDLPNPLDWRFDDPPPLSDEFLEDFTTLVEHCERAGLQLLPSLIDFHFCFPGAVVPHAEDFVKSGR